jgi:hypothetical protein
MKRTILLLPFLVLMSFQLFAQDIILKKNDDMIKCKVKEVGLDEIKYVLPEYPQDVLFSIDKDLISKVIFENGEELIMSKEMTNPANYQDNHKNIIKTEFLAPLSGNTTFSWEHSLRPGRSFEATLGIAGLGLDYDDNENAGGVFLKFGYKMIKSPDFYLRGMKYAHLLKGSYIKPEIMMGLVGRDNYYWENRYDPLTGYYDGGYERREHETVFAAAVQVVFGKQWVFDNLFAIDPYFGIGYGFNSSKGDYNDGYNYGFWVPSNEVPISMSVGLKMGLLFK